MKNTEKNETVERATMDYANVILDKLEDLLRVYIHTTKYFGLDSMSKITENGFYIIDLNRIMGSIYNNAYCNNVDIYDINISETTSNKKCILFDAYIGVIKNIVDLKINLRLDYNKDEGIKFIKASVYNYGISKIKFVNTVDKLNKVINDWSSEEGD